MGELFSNNYQSVIGKIYNVSLQLLFASLVSFS